MKFLIVIFAFIACASAAYNQHQFNYAGKQHQVHQVAPVQYHHSASPDASAPVLRSSSDVNPDGSYNYAYETGNGIAAQESGVGGHSASGSAAWTAPDGTPVQLSYVADENGYQPVGSHIPTPPPVPEAIVRALQWISAHPAKDEDHLGQHQYKQHGNHHAFTGFTG